MIEPLAKDGAFLTDVDRARLETEHWHLWWLGQSGFLLQWQGQHLLLDPYLSDSLTKKYAETDKPHVRMTERVVAPECLDFIQVVTSSHNHSDHLDAQTLKPLLRANPKLELVIPEANREFVADRLGIVPDLLVGLDAGESTVIGHFKFTAGPAAHETVEKDDSGRCKYLGYVIEFGEWTVYHSGDTVIYDRMREILSQWQIDVGLLPINGRAPARRVAGNMNGPEAASLAHSTGMRLVIPCHFEMFEFNTASPAEFTAACELVGQRNRVLRCGERWSSDELAGRSIY
jgi:L-ascorbate metabolism protein UlaG (beta-lactamase superfamily)